MSRTAQVILIVHPDDHAGAENLAFWTAGPDAVDRDQFRGQPDAAGKDLPPLPTVGPLLPINGAVGLEAWGGYKSPSSVIWAGVTNHLNWAGLLDQVATTAWKRPAAVQVLMADEADDCFRLYMIIGGKLVNVVPEPADGDHELPW